MPYNYRDGIKVDKKALVEGVSTFIYADEDSIYYGTTVTFHYDDDDGSPRVLYRDHKGVMQSSYMSYCEMIYLGEYGTGEEED